MPAAFFQVRLSVQPKSGGEAELMPPQVLQGLDYQYVVVKEGGEEGIVKLDGPDSALKQVERDKDCKKLTPRQLEALRANYPKPKLKTKYRTQMQLQSMGEALPMPGAFAVDEAGNKIVDTVQTVRSGFYLIDVPVLTQSTTT
jgi:hypothetical protein